MTTRNYLPEAKERDLIAQLRNARIQQGLTAQYVADRIPGLGGRAEMANFELGRHPASLRKLIHWARALGFELTLTDLTSAPLTVAADSATPPPR